jgi:hypothetical protein
VRRTSNYEGGGIEARSVQTYRNDFSVTFWQRQAIENAHSMRHARGNAAGHPDRGRVRAGLRGERLVPRGRTQEHAHLRCRQAQQRDQRRPCRFQDQAQLADMR